MVYYNPYITGQLGSVIPYITQPTKVFFIAQMIYPQRNVVSTVRKPQLPIIRPFKKGAVYNSNVFLCFFGPTL